MRILVRDLVGYEQFLPAVVLVTDGLKIRSEIFYGLADSSRKFAEQRRFIGYHVGVSPPACSRHSLGSGQF